MNISTTKLSSRGQVVIPESVRLAMCLKEGDKFVVFHHGDAVILKTVSEPAPEEFRALLDRVQSKAKELGIKKSDVAKAVKTARRKK